MYALTKQHMITDRSVAHYGDYPKFAAVMPPQLMQALRSRVAQGPASLGMYHLLLAHDVVEPKNRYAYRDIFKYGMHDAFTIMDNYLIELGRSVDTATMAEACRVVMPDVVVLPDVLGDYRATIHDSADALNNWRRTGMNSFAVVLQGKNSKEITAVMNAFKFVREVTMWCIPRHLTMMTGSREDAVRLVHIEDPTRPIHLLGFSDNVRDDIKCARLAGVSGIDSTAPVRAAIAGVCIENLIAGRFTEPRGTYWDDQIDPNSMAIDRIRLMLRDVRKILMSGMI